MSHWRLEVKGGGTWLPIAVGRFSGVRHATRSLRGCGSAVEDYRVVPISARDFADWIADNDLEACDHGWS